MAESFLRSWSWDIVPRGQFAEYGCRYLGHFQALDSL